MAQCFTSWTVLPHDSIEKHLENLWSISGKMPGGNQRRMAVAKRADGRLVIHNAIALNEDEMKELEAFGEPAFLIVPNGFHRMDAAIYKQRYPKIRVLCPEAVRKKVSAVVEVTGNLEQMPEDRDVEVFHLRGLKRREGAMRVKGRAGAALVFNDTLLNLEPSGGLIGFFMAPSGTLSVPRFSRWMMVNSSSELKQQLVELAETPGLTQLLPGHGQVLSSDVAGQLKQAAARL